MARRTMDPLKKTIAETIQNGIQPLATYRPLLDLDDVVEVEVQNVRPTETMIRVKTQTHGVRYFYLQFREML